MYKSADLQALLSAKIALISPTLTTTLPGPPALLTQWTRIPILCCQTTHLPVVAVIRTSMPPTNHKDHVSVTSNQSVHQPAADPSNKIVLVIQLVLHNLHCVQQLLSIFLN